MSASEFDTWPRGTRWGRRRIRRTASPIYSTITSVVLVVTCVLLSIAFTQAESLVDLGGLFQLITLTRRLGLADAAGCLTAPSWLPIIDKEASSSSA